MFGASENLIMCKYTFDRHFVENLARLLEIKFLP
jgi:hypothetical protein